MPNNTIWQTSLVTRKNREQRNGHQGKVVWLTGLPGSGKSTIARGVEVKLYQAGFQVVVLDGDNIRQSLCADLGFSWEDRNENIRRVGEVAKLFLMQGTLVLVALISPVRDARDKLRQSFSTGDFIEVYCECPLEICKQRDPKGMYAKADGGNISTFTGISSPYEAPFNPDLLLETGNQSLDTSVNQLTEFLRNSIKIIHERNALRLFAPYE